MMQDTATQPDVVTVLGIETSCDETAAAIVRLNTSTGEGSAPNSPITVLSDKIATQTEEHALYGGVVPEIAARAHADRVDNLIALAMKDAHLNWNDLDAVAATAGPGLIGGVMVGLSTAKAISLARSIPLIAVNHLEGHALSPRLGGELAFPYLLLLVSGGHCQFLVVEGLGQYTRLGSTIDDAAGEAFDKTAKLLGLPSPGGPSVEKEAKKGDPKSVKLPRPLMDRPGLDMSFSGLKTAVRRAAEAEPFTDQRRADICASFQEAVADVLGRKTERAINLVQEKFPSISTLVVAGGVAANKHLRTRLEAEAARVAFAFAAPPMRWCTDNAAMIALAGAERLKQGLVSTLDVPARARWPLDEEAANNAPAYGGGKKGAKA